MKKIILISSAALFMYLTTQISGCGSCCEAKANSIEKSIVVEKTKIVQLKITGMTCAGCSSHVTQTLQGVKGVSKVELAYPGDVATVEFDASKTKTEDLIAAVEKINYKAAIVTDKSTKPTSDSSKTKSCAASCGH